MTDLKFEHVSKRYSVRQRHINKNPSTHSLLAKLRTFRHRHEDFWALRDVSFTVERGETLGIIGHNGAGKSTILKLLSSVTTPTSGEITIAGRLSALIEVGSGFHPELTGRENVYLSGSILGMRRREITRKLERIIDFAGVRDFIDTPVKHYSSGMYLRLGFSIAAHLEPDILLLDEILAVGDAAYQVKCLNRINELHAEGRTVVFVSHDLGAVERLCRRVVLLDHGQVIAQGTGREVIQKYQTIGSRFTPTEGHAVADAILSREADIVSITCLDEAGRTTDILRTGQPARVRMSYAVHSPIDDAIFEVFIYSADGGAGTWCHLTTASPDADGIPAASGPGAVEFEIDEVSFQPGLYHISATIAHEDQPLGTAIAYQRQCLTLRVDRGKFTLGSFYMPHRWRPVPCEGQPTHHQADSAPAR
jgi:ABC-type polysaccharide/polyol phosphate transport system ATPase subunit